MCYIFIYMIWLKDLITENDEDINADLYDNWQEYLDYNQYDLPKQEIIKLKNKFNLNIKQYLKFIFKLSDYKHSEYIIYDPKNETFEYISDIKQWVYDVSDAEMEKLVGHGAESVYNGWIECTLNDLKTHPGKLYHYTTEEKWELIQQSGELRGSSGTGLTNRYSHGIFTSVDPEEHASGSYGDVCLEIDMDAFKKENNLAEVNVQYEPDVEEYLMRDLICHTLELEDFSIDIPSDMSPYTIIIGHTIPIQFIKQI
jgi:hypothetical protein